MGLMNKFRKIPLKNGVIEEVTQHLDFILNTKLEYGAWQHGFGMRSYTSGKPRSEMIEQMIEDIRKNIDQFEKRIKVISVVVEDDKSIFNPRFQIRCKIGQKHHSFYIGFKQTETPMAVEVI